MEKSKPPQTEDNVVAAAAAAAESDRTSIVGETEKFDAANLHDQGAAMFQEIQHYTPDELEAESEKVRRLIDWHIMPIVSGGVEEWRVTC